ncbi:hypothetical protein Tco_0267076 [Tanacetum coccineum]
MPSHCCSVKKSLKGVRINPLIGIQKLISQLENVWCECIHKKMRIEVLKTVCVTMKEHALAVVADGYVTLSGKGRFLKRKERSFLGNWLSVKPRPLGLESVEARLLVYKKNESVYEEDIKVLKCEIHLREVAITELRRKLELAQKQKDEIQPTVENFENLSKNLSKLIDYQIVDK